MTRGNLLPVCVTKASEPFATSAQGGISPLRGPFHLHQQFLPKPTQASKMAFFFKIVKIIAKLVTINSLVIQVFPYGLGFIRCKMVAEIEAVLNNVFLA